MHGFLMILDFYLRAKIEARIFCTRMKTWKKLLGIEEKSRDLGEARRTL